MENTDDDEDSRTAINPFDPRDPADEVRHMKAGEEGNRRGGDLAMSDRYCWLVAGRRARRQG